MREDRSSVRSKVFTLKLSQTDRELLDRLVEARAAELRKLTGQTIEVSIASYLRLLWETDARSRRLLREDTPQRAASKSKGRS